MTRLQQTFEAQSTNGKVVAYVDEWQNIAQVRVLVAPRLGSVCTEIADGIVEAVNLALQQAQGGGLVEVETEMKLLGDEFSAKLTDLELDISAGEQRVSDMRSHLLSD